MKTAIYPGSFDPWSLGHQFVLDSALKVFDCVHIVIAYNPIKEGKLDLAKRAAVVAHILSPLTEWSPAILPHRLHYQDKDVVIHCTQGLVADYAREIDCFQLLRGLRSTSDFESELKLYFANRALLPGLQTWTIMCPPELLHYSSSYVRAVVGHGQVVSVGTSFLAQSLILKRSPALGEIFDLLSHISQNKTPLQSLYANLLNTLPARQDDFFDGLLGKKIIVIKQKIQKKPETKWHQSLWDALQETFQELGLPEAISLLQQENVCTIY